MSGWPPGLVRLPAPPAFPAAACRGVDPDLFHPERGESARPAKAVCRTCPHLDECRAFALAAPRSLQGVWGGTTQRDRLRRKVDHMTEMDLDLPATNGHQEATARVVDAASWSSGPTNLSGDGSVSEPEARTCARCGGPLTAKQIRSNGRYCSVACSARSSKTVAAAKTKGTTTRAGKSSVAEDFFDGTNGASTRTPLTTVLTSKSDSDAPRLVPPIVPLDGIGNPVLDMLMGAGAAITPAVTIGSSTYLVTIVRLAQPQEPT